MTQGYEKRAAIEQARRFVAGQKWQQAIAPLSQLLERGGLAEGELRSTLADLGTAYRALGQARAASSVALYVGDHDAALALSSHPLDQARAYGAAEDPVRAARAYEEAGWLGHAALQCERAKDDRAARVLWERLAASARLSSDPYVSGLVAFNLGRACQRLGDRAAARKALVRSMHLLTAAADGFEAQGQRERAFDCYGVLLTMGKEGSFENLAEGYLNCIRILGEDGLRYYVVQYYEDFQALAMEREELHAAATLFREAAEYARRQRLPYTRHYRYRGALASALQGDRALATSGSADMAENAYTAAIDAMNELGLYSKARELYAKLASLPLAEKRKERYARLATRLAAIADDTTPMQGFPDYLRVATAYPPIWTLDVVEWEQDGDPAETMIEVALDRRWADFQRRRALLVRLKELGAPPGTDPAELTIGLAGLLGTVELYVSLAPLERMMTSEDARVRAAAMHAMIKLFFKRTFVSVIRGLADPAPEVRREALLCVSSLAFVHALDPLSRIYREASDPNVRRAALTSIGKVNRIEAVELLVEAFRNGDEAERAVASAALRASEQPDTRAIIEREIAAESGPMRDALTQLHRALVR